ncbi:E3 ubiquitin- ligase TRIM13 [Pelobates cultripes]|uniref:E3 ubiquitin- ligase TRIM13 n=1 Tax=Pelobates cultripes TaxID=61616 RepID=A0AAD1S0B3_PELCU|nr:E3 ubiquitin- ligase TRIM13 [Pelobates cultripes]
MEEDLTCPICCNLFEDPRLLSCSHTFCNKCLERICENNSRSVMNVALRPTSVKCPFCRKESLISDVHGFQVNHPLKGIIEKYNRIQASPKTPVCDIHREQPLNMFCATDRKLICGYCATSEEHKQHAFSSINDAYDQEKSSFLTLIEGFENLYCDVTSNLRTLEANKQEVLQSLSMECDKVEAYFKQLQHTLQKKKTEILAEVHSIECVIAQAYDLEINRIKEGLNEEINIYKIAKDFKTTSDWLLFQHHIEEFKEKIGLMKEIPLPSDDIVSPVLMKLDIDISAWNNSKLADLDKICLRTQYPTRNYNMGSKIPHLFWIVSAAGLIFATMGMALFLGYFCDMAIEEYTHAVMLYLTNIIVTAAGYVSPYLGMVTNEILRIRKQWQTYVFANWSMMVKEILRVGERCQTYYLAFKEQVTKLAFSIEWK